MSGVFGILDPRVDAPLEAPLQRLGESLLHLPWQRYDASCDPGSGAGLGRVGLGIFNPEPQPRRSEDGALVAVMSGEFYETDSLRGALAADGVHLRDRSDVELALRLYQSRGERFVQELDGAFILAIWDGRRRCLVLANDRYGLYPTYLAWAGERFLFGPQVKPLLADPGVDSSLRDDALAEYFRFQHLLGHKTFFAGVHLLPPASTLVIEHGKPGYRLNSYWDMGQVALHQERLSFPEAVEEGSRLLLTALARRTKGLYKVGVFLSGGLDGRSILGTLPQDGRRVHTFTFGQPGCRDEVYARQIARVAGSEHHYYPYANGSWIQEFAGLHVRLTEGFHSWLHMHGIHILPDVRQFVDVNLSGMGDLIWFQSRFTPRHLVKAPDDLAFNTQLFELYSQKYTWPGITYAEERYIYSDQYASRLPGLAFDSFMAELKPYVGLPYPQRAAAFNLLNHYNRYLGYSVVFGRAFIEYRLPYFDLDLLSFCYGLPFELGEERRLQKAIISQKMPSLALVPYTDDELPVTDRGKARTRAFFIKKIKSGLNRYVLPLFPAGPSLYADYESWLRKDLRHWAEDLLFNEQTLARGIFRPEALRSLWQRHLSGQEEWVIGKIASIISFEMAMRVFG